MKTYHKLFFLLFFITINSNFSQAQVDEIGLYYEGKGFIQDISLINKFIIVNVKQKEGLIEQLISLKDPVTNSLVSGIAKIEELGIGMEIEIIGESFPKQDFIVAKKIKVVDFPKKISIKEGRIHDIFADYAIIDGHKIKMKKDGKIIGDKKYLYKGKVFPNFKALKLGDFADVIGAYDSKGYILASEIQVSPDLERDIDFENSYIDRGNEVNEIIDNWNDPLKRESFFGINLPDRGPIVRSKSLQNYVEKIGMDLIPKFLKDKVKFKFIVFNNKEWNATATPDGLVSIYTGFLEDIENEAQLIAVLGHEITHVFYKHSANRQIQKEKTVNNISKSSTINQTASNAIKLFSNWVDIPLTNNKNVSNRKFKSNLDSLSSAMKAYVSTNKVRKLSLYNIENESQCDRVGLYFMAKNGYDPREAMKIWKKHYNKESHSSTENALALQTTAGVNTFSKEFKRFRKLPTSADLGIFILKNSLKNTAINNKKTSYYSDGRLVKHPENIKRFTALNELTNLYYSNCFLKNDLILGEDKLKNILKIAENESKEEELKILNELIKKNVAAYNKEKNYEKELNKIELALSKKNNFVLSYYGYNIGKLLTVNDLIGKSSCKVNNLDANLLEQYNDILNKQTKFINEFKIGKINPTDKNYLFSLNYLLSTNYNKFLTEIAARIKICDKDFLNALNEEIDKGHFVNYIEPSRGALSEIYNYLNEKEEEKKGSKIIILK